MKVPRDKYGVVSSKSFMFHGRSTTRGLMKFRLSKS
jgi:hypothetical protein